MNKQRIISLTTVIIFLGIIFGLAAAFVIKPAKVYSTEERRKLQQLPAFSWEGLKDGSFTSAVNEYLNDQFPLRDNFVGLECDIEKLLLKKENNGVVFGDNGQLAVRFFSAYDGKIHDDGYVAPLVDYFYENNVNEQLGTLKKLAEEFDAIEVPFSVLLPPRTIDVACSAFDYPSDNSDKLINFVSSGMDSEGVNFIDMYEIYRARYDNGEYVYFKTDHHWTALGAYYAYVEVMKSFGLDFYDIDDFDIHTASDEFYGTTYSKSGNKSVAPDAIEYWTLKGDSLDGYKMEVYEDKDTIYTFDGLYDFAFLNEKLEGSDKYAMFLSGTNPLTLITKKDGEPRQTLLLLKDSFGHALAPFLALHFDLVIVDLAQCKNVLDIIKSPGYFHIDKALVCYNLENLVILNMLGKAETSYKLVNGWDSINND